MELAERYHRQLGLLPLNVLNTPITVIGAGAVGSFVTLTLAKMGFTELTVYDDDTITAHNLPNQFFRVADVGRPKVEALRDLVWSFEDIPLKVKNARFKGDDVEGIVVSAVDSMSSRKLIFKSVEGNPSVRFFLDPRMGGQLSVLYAFDPTDIDMMVAYKETLHSDEDASEAPCTERAILYTVLSIASMVANYIRAHLVESQVPFVTQRCHVLHVTTHLDGRETAEEVSVPAVIRRDEMPAR